MGGKVARHAPSSAQQQLQLTDNNTLQVITHHCIIPEEDTLHTACSKMKHSSEFLAMQGSIAVQHHHSPRACCHAQPAKHSKCTRLMRQLQKELTRYVDMQALAEAGAGLAHGIAANVLL
jgi:hypothetical protein